MKHLKYCHNTLRIDHSVYGGINHPKNTTPSFLPTLPLSPLDLQTVQAHLFRQSPTIYWFLESARPPFFLNLVGSSISKQKEGLMCYVDTETMLPFEAFIIVFY